MIVKEFDKYVAFGIANRLAKYFTGRSLYGKAALAAIAMIGVINSTSLGELLVMEVVKPILVPAPADKDIISPEQSKLLLSLFLLLLASYWVRMAYKDQRSKTEASKLVFEKNTAQIAHIGNSRVFAFCGSVTQISGIELIVTSENTDLDLGTMTGTSVSGRIRHLAAKKSATGEVIKDNLGKFVETWKTAHNKFTNFPLGHCVECSSPFEAVSHGIKTIVLAVAIKKNSDGTATVDEAAINTIVGTVIDIAVRKNQTTVFIPVFGLGSGNSQQGSALKMTTKAVKSKLRTTHEALNVYLGVYRLDDLGELFLAIR